MPLNDIDIHVMQTMIMRFNEDESLAWINSHLPKKAKKMSIRVFYRIKGKLKSTTDKRKFDLQKQGLWEQHLERIDQLEIFSDDQEDFSTSIFSFKLNASLILIFIFEAK